MPNENDRFWVLDFHDGDHLKDAIKSIINGEIACIVDEEAGGIVAYVIDPLGYHRTEEFAAALNVMNEG